MKTFAIIQARLGASRLPGKVLLKVLDKTILEYVAERVKASRNVQEVIVATTVKKEDSAVANLVVKRGINVFRGSEEDVLDRYYQAAKLFKVKNIVRITADCPLIDPKIIDEVIKRYFDSGADYCSNTLEESFPDGEDVEVFSFNALSDAWENANLLSEREHVTSYIKKHPEKFKLVSMKNKENLSGKRWTLDRREDFEFIRLVLEYLYPKNPNFHMEDVLGFLQENPHLEDINKGFIRNEGYVKSLKYDKKIH